MNAEATILLVEDDPSDVFLMERMFKKAEITQNLFVAKDGVEAIAYLTKADTSHHPDKVPVPLLILLDLKLPLKSGLEVLKWIREQPSTKQIPVVVFTSSIDRGDIRGAYDCGVNGYFLKTGSLRNLQTLVNLWRDYWLIYGAGPHLLADHGPLFVKRPVEEPEQ